MKATTKHRHIGLLIFALILNTLASVGVAVEKPKSSMVYGETGRLDTLDPYTIHEAPAQRLADLLFDSLISIAPGGTYIPELAVKWDVAKSGTAVTFTLRDGVLWNGGEEKLTAQDVATTVRLIQAEGSEIPNRERFNSISSVEVIAPDKLTIKLKRASIDPLRSLMFKILPHHVVGSYTSLKRDSAFAKHPIGTGAYAFVQANEQGEVLLVENRKYFKGAPKIARLVMKSYADQSIMAQSLMFNSLDLITYVSPRDLSEVLGDKKLTVVPYDALSFTFFAFNTSKGMLKNKRVRQAISHSIKRQEMLNAFFSGKGQLISGPFPPTSWAYNLDVKPLDYDLNRAKELFASAGLKDSNGDGFLEGSDGKNLNLLFAVPLTGESEMIKRIVLAFQEYLGAAGLKVELQFMDWLVWKKRVLGQHDYDITIASWSFDDANNITSLFHSSSAVPWGNNFVLFKNTEVDSLLSEADATSDFDKRRTIYQKLHAVLADEAPYTYLWTLQHHAAHSTRLSSVQVEPYSFFKHIINWKMGAEAL